MYDLFLTLIGVHQRNEEADILIDILYLLITCVMLFKFVKRRSVCYCVVKRDMETPFQQKISLLFFIGQRKDRI